MNLGRIDNEPFDAYALSGAVGSHALGDFAESPLLFRRKYCDADKPNAIDSAAFAFGRFFHCYLLEGHAAAMDRYVVLPEDAPRYPTAAQWNAKKPSEETLAAIAWWTDWKAAAGNRTEISAADFALARKMRESVLAKSTARELLDHGKPEVTFRTMRGNVAVQCRPDWFDEREQGPWRRQTMVSLKTVERLSDFERQFTRFAYYRQTAFYQLVTAWTQKLTGVYPREIYLVCEKSEPHDCALFEADEVALHAGRSEVGRLLERLDHCTANDLWPGAPDEIQSITLPEWMLERMDAQAEGFAEVSKTNLNTQIDGEPE